jgi:hypothetical protein
VLAKRLKSVPQDQGLRLMGYRFEFDRVNKVLLGRFEGRFTNESAAEFYEAIRRYSTATDATAGVWDFSSVTEFAANAEFIRQLAAREPAMRDAANRPGFIVAPASFLFGLSRMFQIAGETKRPLLKVVHTKDEALAALGVPDPHFEPLE